MDFNWNWFLFGEKQWQRNLRFSLPTLEHTHTRTISLYLYLSFLLHYVRFSLFFNISPLGKNIHFIWEFFREVQYLHLLPCQAFQYWRCEWKRQLILSRQEEEEIIREKKENLQFKYLFVLAWKFYLDICHIFTLTMLESYLLILYSMKASILISKFCQKNVATRKKLRHVPLQKKTYLDRTLSNDIFA